MSAANAEAAGAPRIGLALSGGGFRAAFFHVGVLTRLAETGVLANVVAISSVSGGSFVSSRYYLELLKRIGVSGTLAQQDYVAAVDSVRASLEDAVRRNPRGRVFWNLWKNLTMLVSPIYSRTDRFGDLLDRYLFKPVGKELGLVATAAYEIAGLQIPLPLEKQVELRKIYDERLPKLVLNSTSLGTGHAWRFTPRSMGEWRPRNELLEIDRNAWLVPANFESMPAITPAQRDFPLALGVAASACFPPLFAPLAISWLYPKYRVKLSDGGVHDNQGVAALAQTEGPNEGLEALAKFDEVIVSDASAQMPNNEKPRSWIPLVLLRANSIYRDRVREEQLVQVPQGRVLLHLRQGIKPHTERVLDENGNAIPVTPLPDVTGPPPLVALDVQERVAAFRTDLDAFHDVERQTLMRDGYQVASRVLNLPAGTEHWPRVAQLMQAPTSRYRRQLEVSAGRFAKPLRLLGLPGIAASLVEIAVVICLAVAAVWAVAHWFEPFDGLREWRAAGVAAALVVAPVAAGRLLARVLNPMLGRASRSGVTTAAVARWIPVMVYPLAIVLIVALNDKIAQTTGLAWSRWQLVLSSTAVMTAPALLAWLLAALWLLEGKLCLRLGRLPT